MAARKPKRVNTAIEPTRLSLPAMDRPSVAFAWFLDSISVEAYVNDDVQGNAVYLTCDLCSTWICTIEDGDTLRVLLNTALAHTCST